MATTAPMFLELEQEERERELEQLGHQQQLLQQQETKQSTNEDESRQLTPEEHRLMGKRVLLAAEKNNLMDLVRILHEQPSLVNYSDQDGYTPLHRASYGNNLDSAKYLVRHGANIEARTNEDWRPLHCAVRWNNVEVTEFLVGRGADVNARSSGDNTPLHILCSNGRYSLTFDLIQLLLFHPNCDYSIRNQSGDTAFEIAKRGGPFYRLWAGVTTLFPHDHTIAEQRED